jgi:acyl carrier protein
VDHPGHVWVDGRLRSGAGEDDPLTAGLAVIWQAGIGVRIEAFFEGGEFARVPLPGYRFKTERFWHLADAAPAATPRDDANTLQPESDPAGPSSASQVLTQLMIVWAEVLGESAVTADLDFYEAGGDSLAALEVVAEVERLFGVTLEADDIFAQPTPRCLAPRISAVLSGEDESSSTATVEHRNQSAAR